MVFDVLDPLCETVACGLGCIHGEPEKIDTHTNCVKHYVY